MTGENVFDFVEFLDPTEIEGVEADDPTWLEIEGAKYIMALVRSEKTGCYFLNQKTRLCSIYAARPLLCRLYPFEVVEDKKGNYKGFRLHKDVGCPKHADGVVDVKPLYDLYIQDDLNQEDYQELVKIFNSKSYAGKDPRDFVLMFMNGFSEFDPKGPIK